MFIPFHHKIISIEALISNAKKYSILETLTGRPLQE